VKRSIKDLRGFLDLLNESGELATIRVEVDPWLEIAAITDRVCKQPNGGKALRFDRVKGSAFPVLTNLFGSRQRTAWALWTDHVEHQADRLAAEIAKIPVGSAEEKLLQLVDNPTWLPRLVPNPPCQEVVEKDRPDVSIIPALKSWPRDGGRFLTMPMVFTRDPATGRDNCGMYRVQIFGPQLLGLHWGKAADGARHAAAWQARKKPMPIAIALGGDPVLTYAATAPLPPGIEETAFAGYLRQKSLESSRCLTSELEVPALAEFVIEGYLLADQTLPEGPFGNHTGYYAPPEPVQVMQVTAITHRHDALYPCTVVGRPPMENCYLAKATERLFLPLIQTDHPEIKDLNMPLEGIFHGCALVAIRKEEAGQGKRIIRDLWAKGFLRGSRLLVILDEDVRVQDFSESFWRTLNHLEPTRDVVIDGSKIGIDATRKGPDEGKTQVWLQQVELDDKTRRLVQRRWKDYDIDAP